MTRVPTQNPYLVGGPEISNIVHSQVVMELNKLMAAVKCIQNYGC